MLNKGKKHIESRRKVIHDQNYSIEEAVKLVKEAAFVKFDESVDIAIRLGVDPRHADQIVRGTVSLPHGIGKSIRVAVFAVGDKEKEALAAGADIVGSEDLIEKIQAGWLEFDAAIATPDLMGKVGKLGKILGPRGLMPNPKVGTVTFELEKAVKEIKGGRIEFRVDKAGIVHAPVGKVSFTKEKLQENIMLLLETIIKAKPAASKGKYLQSIYLSSTMGPGVKIDVQVVSNLIR